MQTVGSYAPNMSEDRQHVMGPMQVLLGGWCQTAAFQNTTGAWRGGAAHAHGHGVSSAYEDGGSGPSAAVMGNAVGGLDRMAMLGASLSALQRIWAAVTGVFRAASRERFTAAARRAKS